MLLQVCFADLLWLVVERAYATQETLVGLEKTKKRGYELLSYVYFCF